MPRRSTIAAPRTSTPAPDRTTLREAALTHLGRYATTGAGLIRVLDRRIDRWARTAGAATAAAQAAAARDVARQVVAELVGEGAVSDAAFAEARARRLVRAGRSRIAVAGHLAAHGVAPEIARAATLGDVRQELAAALALARRRRLGPFRDGTADAAERTRDLGVLARAGFARGVAEQALATDRDAAESLVAWLRRGGD